MIGSDVVDVVDVAAVDNVVTATVGVVFSIIFEYRSLSIASIPIFGLGVTDVVTGVIISDLAIVAIVVEIVDDVEAKSMLVLVEVLVMEVVNLVVVVVKVVVVVD